MRAQAVKKLETGRDKGKFDKYGTGMKTQLCEYLKSCCENEEFAQAVVQGGSYEDCMKAVVSKGCGTCLPDLDAIRRAVEFYFPGATVHFDIRLDLIGDAAAPEDKPAEPPEQKVLNLSDFWR